MSRPIWQAGKAAGPWKNVPTARGMEPHIPRDNQATPVPAPSLLLSTDAGLEGFTFAAGAFALYAANYAFPEDGPQRYSLVDNDGSYAFVTTLNAAWQAHRRFRIGVGLQNYSLRIQSTVAGTAYSGLFGRPEDADLDLMLQGVAEGAFNLSTHLPSSNLGHEATALRRARVWSSAGR